jgi:hypothetical protein
VTLPSDGKPLVLTPGGPAVLVTEYAYKGVLVINTSTVGRVWLGTSSGVGPQNGTPLEAGTAAPWDQDGQLYAVLDPSAAAAVTSILPGAVSRYDPSPAAIAAAAAPAIAAQLLAQGIPNVLTSVKVGDFTLAAGASTANIAVTGYAGLVLVPTACPGGGGTSVALAIAQFATNPSGAGGAPVRAGAILYGDTYGGIVPQAPPGAVTPPIEFPVYAPGMTITNNSAASVSFSLYGTNRVPPKLAVSGASVMGIQSANTGSVAMTAGTKYQLYANPALAPSLLALPNIAGMNYRAEFIVTGATVKGYFGIVDAQGNAMTLTDTSDTGWHAAAGGTDQHLYTTITIPPNASQIYFQCGVAGTAIAFLRLIAML